MKKSLNLLSYIFIICLLLCGSMQNFVAEEYGTQPPVEYHYGSKDGEYSLYMKYATDQEIYETIQANGFSNEIVVKFLDNGRCHAYIDELKAQGRVPQDYVPPSANGGSANSGSSSTPETEASTEKTYTQDEIDGAWKEVKRTEPTCTEEGSIQYKNSLTGKKKTETLPMIEHIFEETSTTESTCTTVGYTYFVCSGCGLEGEPLELPLKEHSFEPNEAEAIMPTCTEEGTLPLVCSDCGELSSKSLAATGHVDGEWKVTQKAKAFTEGKKVLICTVCATELDSEIIPQTCPVSLGTCIGIGVVLVVIVSGCTFIVLKKKKASNS